MYALRALFLFSVLALSSCAYNRAMHNAEVYADHGMHHESFLAYNQAWHNRSRAEAKVGMIQAAEKHLIGLVQEGRAELIQGNTDAAKDALMRADAFNQSVAHLQLKSEAQRHRLEADLNRTCKENGYAVAKQAMLDRRYALAGGLLEDFLREHPDHQEARYLLLLSELHRAYDAGKAALESGLIHQAYNHFLEVTRHDAQFKDALALRDSCLDMGAFRLAFVPIPHAGNDTKVEAQLAARIQQAVLDMDNPFIRLLERENIDHLVAEQRQGLSGLFDQEQAAQAGKFEGAEFVLTVELLNRDVRTSPLETQHLRGFMGEHTKSEKVHYSVHHRRRTFDARVRFQVIHSETGQVFATRMVPFHHEDVLDYAKFNGDKSGLYPGQWTWAVFGSRNDVVYIDAYEELQTRLHAPKQLPPLGSVEVMWMDQVATAVQEAVDTLEPGRR